MSAVYRHELASYFTNLAAWVFGAFLLLFAGIYMMAYNLHAGYSNFEYVFGGMCFVFLVAVPVLTMRVIAEEKRQRTDQLLYSLPLSMTRVVLGKYLALLTAFALPVAIICLYPLLLRLPRRGQGAQDRGLVLRTRHRLRHYGRRQARRRRRELDAHT